MTTPHDTDAPAFAPPPLPQPAPMDDWRAPPARAVRLHAWTNALLWIVLVAFPSAMFWMMADTLGPFLKAGLIALAVALAVAVGWLIGSRLKHQRWRLDHTGLWLRRGRAWMTETRMPASRVQHLDVKHGPLERRAGLATLVLHTAGTRLTAVTVRGLDEADAQHLRDALSRQVDDEH